MSLQPNTNQWLDEIENLEDYINELKKFYNKFHDTLNFKIK